MTAPHTNPPLMIRTLANALFACMLMHCAAGIAPALQAAPMLQAAPKLHLVSATTKAWLPGSKGDIPVIVMNKGDAPLLIAAVTLSQQFNKFSLSGPLQFPKILAPGDTSFLLVNFNAQLAFEYNCELRIQSNDPISPITIARIRVNDSIPPNPVSSIVCTPLKGGELQIAWSLPSPARDGDSVGTYKLVGKRPGGSNFLIGQTRDRNFTTTPPGEGELEVWILVFDDMGNYAARADTTWTDAVPPKALIRNIDNKSVEIPAHVAIGSVPVNLSVEDAHLAHVWVTVGDTGAGSAPTIIYEHFGGAGKDQLLTFSWDSRFQRGMKELTIHAKDSTDNASTITYRFELTQASGWPRLLKRHELQPSSPLVCTDAEGPFIMLGSAIADGLFRPDGEIFYAWYPLDVVRPMSRFFAATAADLDPQHPGTEILVGSPTDTLLMLSSEGRLLRKLTGLAASDVITSVTSTSRGEVIATGASPVLLEAGDSLYLYGGTSAVDVYGDKIDVLTPIEQSITAREPDRFVAGDLDRDGSVELVRIFDDGANNGEKLAVYSADGKLRAGFPIPLWSPKGLYEGFYPSLGDLDGDGKLEVVIVTHDDSLRAFKYDGTPQPHFPRYVPTHAARRNVAILADMDDDGASDVVIPCSDSIVCVSGNSGKFLDGFWPIHRHVSECSMLSAFDIDSDGKIELIEGPEPSSTELTWGFVYRTNALVSNNAIQWGGLQHDMARSGNFEVNLSRSAVAEQQRTQLELQVYPNPAAQMLNLVVPSEIELPASLEISDAFGKLIGRYRVNSHSISIDLQGIPAGLYVTCLRSSELTLTARFIAR